MAIEADRGFATTCESIIKPESTTIVCRLWLVLYIFKHLYFGLFHLVDEYVRT